MFIERFEGVARAKKWDDSQKLDHLCVILIGDPSEYMHWQKAEVKKSYSKSKEVLARVYGKETNPTLVRAELANVHQKEGEDVEEYGRMIFRLLYQAYLDASDKMLEDLGIGFYSRGCIDRYAVEIAMIMDPKTLKEAIQFTKVAQSNHSFIGQSKRSVRNVTFADEGNVSVRRIHGGDSPQGGQAQLKDGSLEKMTDILSKMLTVIESQAEHRSRQSAAGDSPIGSPMRTRAASPMRTISHFSTLTLPPDSNVITVTMRVIYLGIAPKAPPINSGVLTVMLRDIWRRNALCRVRQNL